MTATVPDLTVLDALDFDPVISCGVLSCHNEPDTARHAVMVVVLNLPCCTIRRPICVAHREYLLLLISIHTAMICGRHGEHACAHSSITFEPLP